MKKGRCGTMTHDYKRNGTTTLFAALEVLEGRVVGQCFKRHRHQEFLKFLRRLDQEFPGKTPLHLVMDNYGTHKTPEVQAWLKHHRRFVPHFIPTSSSWLNLVERWFGELTQKAVRRGAFHSVPDLVQTIEAFLAAWNTDPKPFLWTATVASIQQKLARCRQDAGANPAWLYSAPQKEEETVQLILGHYTRWISFMNLSSMEYNQK